MSQHLLDSWVLKKFTGHGKAWILLNFCFQNTYVLPRLPVYLFILSNLLQLTRVIDRMTNVMFDRFYRFSRSFRTTIWQKARELNSSESVGMRALFSVPWDCEMHLGLLHKSESSTFVRCNGKLLYNRGHDLILTFKFYSLWFSTLSTNFHTYLSLLLSY